MSRISRASAGLLVTLSGCGFPLSTLGAASPSARSIAWTAMIMAGLAAVIFVVVCLILVLAARRNRHRDPGAPDLTPHGHGWVIWGGAIIPGLVLLALFVINTIALGRFPMGRNGADLVVKVIGHQWWWEVQYQDQASRTGFTTANEIHVPVGQPVALELTSADVIHSFWVPELNGKLDLIPGDTNYMRLTADRPGRYLGECAEYCGMQHAHMRVVVVADTPEDFTRWLAGQRAPARAPADSFTAMGQRLVVQGPCAVCHTIRGTPARGRVAPDLTHIGSRLTIAAGAYPNTMGYLEAWITNAQSLKPGALMPSLTQFTGPELRAMTIYLSHLK